MSAMRGMGPRTSAARLGRSGLRWLRGDGLRLGGGARRRPSVAVAAAIAGLLVVLACGWLWFRDSSLVAVKRVQITGVSGPSASRIREALRSSALEMTTLTVDMSRLRAAVQPYPDVKTLRVSTQFPHGVTIHVFEQVPVAALSAGGRTVAVSAGGELLGRPLASDQPEHPSPGGPAARRRNPGSSPGAGGGSLAAARPHRPRRPERIQRGRPDCEKRTPAAVRARHRARRQVGGGGCRAGQLRGRRRAVHRRFRSGPSRCRRDHDRHRFQRVIRDRDRVRGRGRNGCLRRYHRGGLTLE
jgi:hypothetical protein